MGTILIDDMCISINGGDVKGPAIRPNPTSSNNLTEAESIFKSKIDDFSEYVNEREVQYGVRNPE